MQCHTCLYEQKGYASKGRTERLLLDLLDRPTHGKGRLPRGCVRNMNKEVEEPEVRCSALRVLSCPTIPTFYATIIALENDRLTVIESSHA